MQIKAERTRRCVPGVMHCVACGYEYKAHATPGSSGFDCPGCARESMRFRSADARAEGIETKGG